MRGSAFALREAVSVGLAIAALLFLLGTVGSGPTCDAWPAGQEVEPTPPPDDETGGGGDDETGGSGDVEVGGAEPAGDVEVNAQAGDLLAITLKWSTASEVDISGFDIYRSIDEDGEFERISDDPVPGFGTTDEPQYYVYVDESIEPDQGYYYYIESITNDGVREQFSPIIYVAPDAHGRRGEGHDEED